jgi:hypothetical protein
VIGVGQTTSASHLFRKIAQNRYLFNAVLVTTKSVRKYPIATRIQSCVAADQMSLSCTAPAPDPYWLHIGLIRLVAP